MRTVVSAPAAAPCLLALVLSHLFLSSFAFVPASPPFQRYVTIATQHKSTTVVHQTQSVFLETELDDDKITQLYAWVSRALAGDPRY